MSGDFSHYDMWYLDIRAGNHIMTIRYFYHSIDENQKGIGGVHVDYTHDEHNS